MAKIDSPKKKAKHVKSRSFPIVGIGASAGGLEALEGFFKKMSSNSNIAFVVIQHLSPKHKSIMGTLLKKHTTMKIFEVVEGMTIEPNCVYLNPPNKNMSIFKRKLKLKVFDKSLPINLPIDSFFRSLSQDQAEKAICIILSGTGTDGTLGAKAIKGAGGMAMVQEEKEAKYDGMPRSAIDTGLIDYILPVEKMPARLVKYIRHPYIEAPENISVTKHQFQTYLHKIFVLIRAETGHDFSNYKQNTIRRRIERRLAVHQIDNIADYVKYIKQTPFEVKTLFKDLLITVTNFFRDPKAFEVIEKKVIPDIIKNINNESQIRCWVPGCATGEEAYSIAILLVEALEKSNEHINFQIFATDIDDDAIELARIGVYPDSIAADVSPERLKRFFIKEDNVYRIKKQIREMVIFATQNLIKDPPFSKLHLVCCRNLLIYMDQVLQKKILPLFHYTLNQNGALFLGSSESIGEYSDLFAPIDNKWKIFKRQGLVLKGDLAFPKIPLYNPINPYDKGIGKKVMHEADIRHLAQKIILEEYSPSCVIVNEKYEILFFSGDTNKYLIPPVGEPSFNILKMAKKEIRYKISTALHKAIKTRIEVIVENLQIKQNGGYLTIDMIIKPITEPKELPGMVMVIFNDKALTLPENNKLKKISEKQIQDQRLIGLEQELQSTKEYLQTTIEELETSNEELKSTNEELQSTNEELQSTNEELETSKEELQSTNEELITVNSELQNKVDELSQANDDINNLLASTEIGTIFLNKKLHIKRFTPSMTKIFNLIQTDIDRPISDITSNINYAQLFKDTEEVLNTLVRKEVEIENKKNDWYSMRIAPYRTTEDVIDGVVITFIDITEIKKTQKQLQESESFLDSIYQGTDLAISVLDVNGPNDYHYVGVNKKHEEVFGIKNEEYEGKKPEQLQKYFGKEVINSIIRKYEKCIETKMQDIYEIEVPDKSGRKITWLNTMFPLIDNNGNVFRIIAISKDLTDHKLRE